MLDAWLIHKRVEIVTRVVRILITIKSSFSEAHLCELLDLFFKALVLYLQLVVKFDLSVILIFQIVFLRQNQIKCVISSIVWLSKLHYGILDFVYLDLLIYYSLL